MHIMNLGKACLFLDSKAIYFYIDVKGSWIKWLQMTFSIINSYSYYVLFNCYDNIMIWDNPVVLAY